MKEERAIRKLNIKLFDCDLYIDCDIYALDIAQNVIADLLKDKFGVKLDGFYRAKAKKTLGIL